MLHSWPAIIVLFGTIASAQSLVLTPGGGDATADDSNLPVAAQVASFEQFPCWIENRGQWPDRIRFVARAGSTIVRAEPAAIGLQFRTGPSKRRGVLIRLNFVGANLDSVIEPEDPNITIDNYFLGRDPDRWVRDAMSFATLRYREIYPGVDLVLHMKGANAKYDLIFKHARELSEVCLRWEGSNPPYLRSDGSIELKSQSASVLQMSGQSWQPLPSGAQRGVHCIWRMVGDDAFCVECADADPELPLVIDPELLWSTYLGSSGSGQGDVAAAVAVTPDGSEAVVTGWTDGSNFPMTPGAFQATTESYDNVFVSKFRVADGALLYSSVFGGTSDLNPQRPDGVTIDALGRAIVVGYTQASDFPTTPGAFDTHKDPGAVWSGFVTQLSDAGDELAFSTYLEGPQSGGRVYAVQYAAGGSIVVGGEALGPDFPSTSGALQPHFAGVTDGFVACLDANGSRLIWSTFLGGATDQDFVRALRISPSGSVCVVGTTGSNDFPTTAGAWQTSKSPYVSAGAFASQIDTNGEHLIWSTYLCGTNSPYELDRPTAVDLAADGSVFVAGATNSSTFPTTAGCFQTQYPANTPEQAFLTRFDPSGARLIYSTYFGAPSTAEFGGLSVDSSGVATVAGIGGSPMPTTPGAYNTNSSGDFDLFVTRFDPDATRIFYSTFIGGPNLETISGLATTPTGRVVVAGTCFYGAYPTTVNAAQPRYAGGQADAVVTAIDLLLQGVRQLGASTPACAGALTMNVTKMPSAGTSDFSFYASGAPTAARGWLLLGVECQTRKNLLGLAIWIDTDQPFIRLPVRADAMGYVETPLPIPARSRGRKIAAQYVFRGTDTCQSASSWRATNALAVTVQ